MRRTPSLLVVAITAALAAAACSADPRAPSPGDEPDEVAEPDAVDEPDGVVEPDEVDEPDEVVEPDGVDDPDGADPDEVDEPDDADRDGAADDPEAGVDLDDPVLERAAQAALADAAQRTGDEATVVAAERVTWSDGSLGCPQPGQMYTQALVEGVRIVVASGDRTLHYHGSVDGEPGYCEDPEPPARS